MNIRRVRNYCFSLATEKQTNDKMNGCDHGIHRSVMPLSIFHKRKKNGEKEKKKRKQSNNNNTTSNSCAIRTHSLYSFLYDARSCAVLIL